MVMLPHIRIWNHCAAHLTLICYMSICLSNKSKNRADTADISRRTQAERSVTQQLSGREGPRGKLSAAPSGLLVTLSLSSPWSRLLVFISTCSSFVKVLSGRSQHSSFILVSCMGRCEGMDPRRQQGPTPRAPGPGSSLEGERDPVPEP